MPSRFLTLKCALSLLLLVALSSALTAQRTNELFDGTDPGAILDDSLNQVYVHQEFDKNLWPALKSLAVPGWGQIHNKQFTKAGIIWGATAITLGRGLAFRKDYVNLRDIIAQREMGIMDDEFYPGTSTLDLRYDENKARLNYRWSIAATGFIHLLNVTDAYASAFILKSEKPHSPTGAALRSAVLPGWGQVYNKRIWKAPIVIGGLGAAGYAIWWNIGKHREVRDELIARRYDDYSAEIPRNPRYFTVTDERLFQARDFYLDQLDTAILIGILVYTINIVDAAVDAHLRDFDIDDDLGIDAALTPAVFPNGAIGLNLQVTF